LLWVNRSHVFVFIIRVLQQGYFIINHDTLHCVVVAGDRSEENAIVIYCGKNQDFDPSSHIPNNVVKKNVVGLGEEVVQHVIPYLFPSRTTDSLYVNTFSMQRPKPEFSQEEFDKAWQTYQSMNTDGLFKLVKKSTGIAMSKEQVLAIFWAVTVSVNNDWVDSHKATEILLDHFGDWLDTVNTEAD